MDSREIRAQIDPKSVEILVAIQELASATTNEIRQRTGLNASEVQYRRSKLTGLGLVDVVLTDTHLGEQYEWHLTGAARRELERGLAKGRELLVREDAESPEIRQQEFRELRQQVHRLQETVNSLTHDLSRRECVDTEELDEFKEYVDSWNTTTRMYLLTMRSVVESHLDGVDDLSDHVVDENQFDL